MRSFAGILGVPVLVVASLGCSSASFEVTSAGDAQPQDSATSDAAPDGSTIDDGATTSEGSVGCPSVPAGEDLYVDSRSTAPRTTGDVACPFLTIADAIAAAGPTGARRILVRGGSATAAREYKEDGVLHLRSGLTLLADTGDYSVRITGAGGNCNAAGSTFACLMLMDPGSTLDGFVVDASGPRDAIVATADGTGSLAVKHSGVTGASVDGTTGMRIFGAADLGPGFQAQSNAKHGISIYGVSTVKLLGGGSHNLFAKNGGSGINMEGGVIVLTNTVVNDNAVYGLRIASSASGTHTIDGLDAHNNAVAGVYVESGASVTVRNSTFLKNRIGLIGRNGTTNFIDLGSPAAPGNNVFAGATTRNDLAGLCFANARLNGGQAEGNKWSACPPVVTPTTVACAFSGSVAYADVYVHGLSGATPATPGGCSVGP